jgi:hypothetical protein
MWTGKTTWTLMAFGFCALACKSSDDDGQGNDAGADVGGSGGTANGGASGSAHGGNGGTNTGGSSGENASGGNAGTNDAGASGNGSGGDSNPDAGLGADTGDSGSTSNVSFFITSTGNATGDLGGLDGADAKCTTLANAAGFGAGKTWHAYLSAENGPGGAPVNAGERIGSGPWYNVNGELLAEDLTALHALNGDYLLFLDEAGTPVPGQWSGSPTPNVHDILTGSNRNGTLMVGYTCSDWTSDSADETAWVGHSDGLGPGGSMDEMYRPWNSVHENGGCNDTAPRGGGGRIACFAVTN